MKGKRKNIFLICFIGLAVVAVLTFAVKTYRDKKQNELWSLDWEDSFCSQFGRSYTENGVLYHSGSYLRFCDNASGEDNLICVDQSCSHKASGDFACGAYIDASIIGGVAIRGNHLLYIADSSDNYGLCSLYAANLEGKERSKIDDLTKIDMIFDVLYHGNMVYVSYMQDLREKESAMVYGIYAYDLEQREGHELFREEGNGFAPDGIAMGEKMLYISYAYSDASKEDILAHSEDEEFDKAHTKACVKGLDPVSGEVRESLDGFGNNNILLYVQGNLFYTKDQDLYIYSESDGSSMKINEKGDFIALPGSCDGKAYFRGYNEKTKELLCLSYNIDAGEWTEQSTGSFWPEGISGDCLYGSDASGSTGWMSLKDFEKGDISEMTVYESQWEE